MKLLIVESPTKTKTLKKFLGKDYQISATMGHIRDLPPKSFGVDLESFDPEYTTIRGKGKIIKNLKKQAGKSEDIILATDPDREGEAIAWHTAQALNLGDDYQRIVFHEITKNAVQKALEEPREIDSRLVNAQQARRILDRIVGYKLSPLLWKKVAKGLSAGRVQSVALRFIVEREREIEGFNPREFWSIWAVFEAEPEFKAKLVEIEGGKLKKFAIKNKKEAQKIITGLEKAVYTVADVAHRESKRNPYPPFITSTLQQEAWYRLHFSSKSTMYLAQRLYEQGLITYHRTDSFSLSQQATRKAKEIIVRDHGKKYWPGHSRRFKTKSKVAQEAHEAIRPTYPEKSPAQMKRKLKKNKARLYKLVWKRFLASQMSPALFDKTKVRIKARDCIFRAKGQTLKFDGFLKVYPVRHKEAVLPRLAEGDGLDLFKLKPKQHFTRPPARYSEATLIKEMKKNGIGRPSTYAPIVSVIKKRNYVAKNQKKRFFPTEVGRTVNDLLVKHFPQVVDVGFTARIEEKLDQIAKGEKRWKKVLQEFYQPFQKNLDQKYDEIEKKVEKTEKKCPQCSAPLVIRMSKYGKFYGCSNFPECKYTKPIQNKVGIRCPQCKEGEITEKRTKKGKVFYGCNQWPECDFALWDKPTGEKCPRCDSLLVEAKKGKVKCSNKECEFAKKQKKET